MARKKIEVEIVADDKISADLDRIEADVRELDALTVEIEADVDTSPATRSLDNLRTETDKTGGVMANFAGNATQDMGEVAGVTGSAGVAMGQFAEYAAEGDIALGNMALTAGGMAGVALVIDQIKSAMQVIAEADAFDTAEIDAFKEALLEGKSAVEALQDELTNTGTVMVRDFGEGMLAALPWGDDTVMRDITDKVVDLGLNVKEFSQLAGDNTVDLDAWSQAMIADGQNVSDVLDVYNALIQKRAKLNLADEASKINRQFLDTGEAVVIPTELETPDTDKVVRDAQAALDANPVTIPVSAVASATAGEAARLGAFAVPNPQPVIHNTIIYPAGTTPTATVSTGNIYYSRNGVRTSP